MTSKTDRLYQVTATVNGKCVFSVYHTAVNGKTAVEFVREVRAPGVSADAEWTFVIKAGKPPAYELYS